MSIIKKKNSAIHELESNFVMLNIDIKIFNLMIDACFREILANDYKQALPYYEFIIHTIMKKNDLFDFIIHLDDKVLNQDSLKDEILDSNSEYYYTITMNRDLFDKNGNGLPRMIDYRELDSNIINEKYFLGLFNQLLKYIAYIGNNSTVGK